MERIGTGKGEGWVVERMGMRLRAAKLVAIVTSGADGAQGRGRSGGYRLLRDGSASRGWMALVRMKEGGGV